MPPYWRAANYLGAVQIYLQANFFLEEALRPEHVKPRLLGHWGTVPGINFIDAHLNRVIREQDASVMLVTGPGHGAPANLANLYLEGSLAEFYPEFTPDRDGLGRLVRGFSWPGGFPSHLTPGTPGTIHEGGELGYALATAFGAAFDNPDLIVACVVGDGEAETGPSATAWHSTKFLSPVSDGASEGVEAARLPEVRRGCAAARGGAALGYDWPTRAVPMLRGVRRHRGQHDGPVRQVPPHVAGGWPGATQPGSVEGPPRLLRTGHVRVSLEGEDPAVRRVAA